MGTAHSKSRLSSCLYRESECQVERHGKARHDNADDDENVPHSAHGFAQRFAEQRQGRKHAHVPLDDDDAIRDAREEKEVRFCKAGEITRMFTQYSPSDHYFTAPSNSPKNTATSNPRTQTHLLEEAQAKQKCAHGHQLIDPGV